MPKQVRWRRGTTAEHATFTGAQGEVTVDITKKTLVVHDGVTPGGWPVNNTPGGSASGQALAISAAGTDTITPAASVLNHFVDATVSAGAGAYVRKLVLSHVGAADGKRIAFHFTLPASANPVIELRDGTGTGTVLLAFSPRPDTAVPRSVDCEHRGGAWRLVDSNEVADKIRESILDAKGRLPVRGASEVVALPAPTRGQMLVGNPDAPEGMNWAGVATARESFLNLYRERVVNPSPLPVAVGDNSIALGAGAYARGAGMIASANGGFNDQAATLQRWAVLLRNQTTDAAQTELFADGVSQRLVLPDNYTWHFEVRVVAREQGGESAAYHFMGCIKRGTGAASVALVGSVDSPMAEKEDSAGWGVGVDADTTNGALRVRVTGGASQTLRWGADVSVVEVFNTGGVAPPVLNDLVLFLKCEEASGTHFDSSGNALDFDAVGALVSGAGKIGAGLALDGNGQMIERADDPLLRLTGDFTIALWAKFNDVSESVTIQRWGGNLDAGVSIQFNPGSPSQLWAYVGDVPGTAALDFNPQIGTWYFITLRVSGTDIKLSINAGVPATGSAAARADTGRPTTFGGISGQGSYSAFNGLLDQIMQWNRALSDGEVAELFNEGDAIDPDPGEPPAPVQSPGLVGGYYNESDGYDATLKGFQLNSHGILPNGTDLVQFQQQNPPVPQFGVEPPVFKVLFTIMARPFGENPPDLSGLPDPEPDNAFEVEMPGMALNLKYDGQPENLLARWMWTLESYVFVTFSFDWFSSADLSKFNVYCKVRTYAEGQELGPVRLLKTPGAPDPV